MAFRKTVKVSIPIFGTIFGFGEMKDVSTPNSDGVLEISFSRVPVYDLSKSALPLIPLTAVLESGKTINGNVDFSPSDPSNYLDVQNAVGNYISRIKMPSSSNVSPSSESDESDLSVNS